RKVLSDHRKDLLWRRLYPSWQLLVQAFQGGLKRSVPRHTLVRRDYYKEYPGLFAWKFPRQDLLAYKLHRRQVHKLFRYGLRCSAQRLRLPHSLHAKQRKSCPRLRYRQKHLLQGPRGWTRYSFQYTSRFLKWYGGYPKLSAILRSGCVQQLNSTRKYLHEVNWYKQSIEYRPHAQHG